MKKVFLFSLISGVALALSQAPYNLEFLVWIGFIPLFLLLKSNLSLKKFNSKFWLGFFAGIIYFAISLNWLWSIYPLDWIDINNKLVGFSLILLIWTISVLGMAMWWGIAFFIYERIKKGKPKSSLLKVLIFPSLFTLTEYLRSWFFGLLWLGSGTLLGPHWTIGNLTYSLHNNPLFLKLSSFIGIYGITFLIALINICLFYLISNKKQGWFKKIGLTLIIISLLYFIPRLNFNNKSSQNSNKIPIAVIQTRIPSQINYPAKQMLDNFKKQLELLKKAASLNPPPKIIIFPESSDFFKNLSLFLNTEKTKNFFENLFKESTLIIDNSSIKDQTGKQKSRIIYLDSKKGILGIYDKRLLTPGGEFLPYPIKAIVGLFFKNQLVKFNLFREFSKGENPPILIKNNLKPEALVCSELFSSNLFRQLSRQNPDFTIVMASTSIFKGNDSLIKQNLAISKFRAAENNKYLLLAANYGYSFVISNKGKLEKISKNKEFQLFTANVISLKNATWYNKLGDYPILMLSLLAIFSITITTKRRRICS